MPAFTYDIYYFKFWLLQNVILWNGLKKKKSAWNFERNKTLVGPKQFEIIFRYYPGIVLKKHQQNNV